jgi:hypothetical protein
MEALTTEPYVSNPEANSSNFIGILIKLCLKYRSNFVGCDSFVPEKWDDHSLMIFHHTRTFHRSGHPGWKDRIFESDKIKSILLYLASKGCTF